MPKALRLAQGLRLDLLQQEGPSLNWMASHLWVRSFTAFFCIKYTMLLFAIGLCRC